MGTPSKNRVGSLGKKLRDPGSKTSKSYFPFLLMSRTPGSSSRQISSKEGKEI